MKEHWTLYSFDGQIDTLDQLQYILGGKLYFKRPLPLCGVSTHSPAVLLAVGDVDHAGDVLAQELVTDLPQHLQLALISPSYHYLVPHLGGSRQRLQHLDEWLQHELPLQLISWSEVNNSKKWYMSRYILILAGHYSLFCLDLIYGCCYCLYFL